MEATAAKHRYPKAMEGSHRETYWVENPKGMWNLSEEARNRLILDYAPHIRHIIFRIRPRLPPSIDLEDLENSGILGLIDAIEKFDPSKGILFKTYAEYRVRGAILDELRALDWVSRSTRQKINRLSQVYTELEQTLGRAATEEEVIEALGVDSDEFYAMLSQVSSVTLMSLDDLKDPAMLKSLNIYYEGANLDAKDIIDSIDMNTLKRIAAEGIEALPERERLVIILYYHEDLNMKEIGAVMEVTESRVSQIHTSAILRLRGRMRRRRCLDRGGPSR